jgi:hypothetical protein
MVAQTTRGHCGTIEVGLGISGGRIHSTSGSFAFYPIQMGAAFPPRGKPVCVQWLARASPMGPDVLGRFGAAGRGPVADLPVSARAFGAPIGPNHKPAAVLGHLALSVLPRSSRRNRSEGQESKGRGLCVAESDCRWRALD